MISHYIVQYYIVQLYSTISCDYRVEYNFFFFLMGGRVYKLEHLKWDQKLYIF